VHTEEGGRVSYKPYQQFSQEFFSALKAFPGLRTVERASIDEAYIELSPTAAGAPMSMGQAAVVAREIKACVMQSLGLVCSAGVAPNKVLAKLASMRSKPDGVLVVDSAQAKEALLDASPGGWSGAEWKPFGTLSRRSRVNSGRRFNRGFDQVRALMESRLVG